MEKENKSFDKIDKKLEKEETIDTSERCNDLNQKKELQIETSKTNIQEELETFDSSLEYGKMLDEFKRLLKKEETDIKTKEFIQKVIKSSIFSKEQIKEIFEKIGEIQKINKIKKYLPDEVLITQKEYEKSLIDYKTRINTIGKLNKALLILSNYIEPELSTGLNLFVGYIAILDKNLIKLQENHIDIKYNLQSIDKKDENLNWWQKIIRFLKDLFNIK